MNKFNRHAKLRAPTNVAIATSTAARRVAHVVLGPKSSRLVAKVSAAPTAPIVPSAATDRVTLKVNRASAFYRRKAHGHERKGHKRPRYSPVPAKITDPAFLELARSETMTDLAPQLVNAPPSVIATVSQQVSDGLKTIQSDYSAAGGDAIEPEPSTDLSADASAAQYDSASASVNAPSIGLLLRLGAAAWFLLS